MNRDPSHCICYLKYSPHGHQPESRSSKEIQIAATLAFPLMGLDSTGPIQFDLEQIATEWISTEMHSNHHGVSAGPKSPHLSIVEFFLSSLEVSMNFQQK